jgi:ABC-type nitrate/sulfonate/bicarbonate transport system ATPase subunit
MEADRMKTQHANDQQDTSPPRAAAVEPAAGPASALLEIRHVCKTFAASGGGQKPVLDDVSLAVAKGEFLSLVGPSGCGKTTLLRIIDGLIEQTSGTILLEGAQVTRQSRRRMGFVFQDANLLPWMTVLSNVALGLEAAGVPKQERRDRALEALRMVGLEDSADAAPYRLSGGMQQRVGVARALALRPALLLMDEPFGHLDMLTKERLQAEMGQLIASLDATVVFVSHDIDEAILLSDRIVTLLPNPGRIAGVHTVPLRRPRTSSGVRADGAAARLRESILTDLGVVAPAPTES